MWLCFIQGVSHVNGRAQRCRKLCFFHRRSVLSSGQGRAGWALNQENRRARNGISARINSYGQLRLCSQAQRGRELWRFMVMVWCGRRVIVIRIGRAPYLGLLLVVGVGVLRDLPDRRFRS